MLGRRWPDGLGRRGACFERDCGRGPCSPNAERTGSGNGTCEGRTVLNVVGSGCPSRRGAPKAGGEFAGPDGKVRNGFCKVCAGRVCA